MTSQLSPVERVVGCLESYKEHRGEFRARCPAHQGRSADSLSIKEGDDGRALLVCHAGCEQREIVNALGLGLVDLFAHNGYRPAGPAKKAGSSKDSATAEELLSTDDLPDGTYYEFTNLAGEVLYIQRHRGAYYRKVGDDLWRGGEGALDDTPRVLYNLPELVDGVRTGRTCYHLEGPKDVETAREKLGVVAATSGGVKTWKLEFKSFYTGADAVIVPDNDDEGREYADTVARSIAPVASRVRVVALPDLPNKGDLTGWLDAGRTPEEFFALVEAAEIYTADKEEPWLEPRTLNNDLPPVAPFTAGMLPEPLGSHVVDAARRMDNVAPDFIAASLIVGAGSIIGRRLALRPKARDDWQVTPNLWGANVGPPSSMKSPAQAAGLAAITRLGTEAQERFKAKSKDHELDAIEKEIRGKHLKDELKKAVKGDDPAAISSIREELAGLSESDEPTEERHTTSDATVEKLGELLRDNPNGLLNDRDELMGWLSALDRAGREGARAFFLESWNGDKPYHVDRVERGSIHVPALCLSIFGGIQPGPLMTYVQDALSESEKADGLLQRFQVLVWPDARPYGRVDEPPDPETKGAVFKIFKALAAFNAEEFGAKLDAFEPTDPEEESEPEGIPFVRFTQEAQAIFDEFRDEFEPRIRSGAYPAAVEAHFLKYRSLFASLALIFEVLRYVSHRDEGRDKGAVGAISAARAAAWCEYLESHAMRLYHPALMAPVMAAVALLDHIEAGDVNHGMKTRDIWRKGWQGLATADDLRRAVEVLEEHGWARRETVKPAGGGRPSEQLHVHPSLRDD
jgi:putative DNA primase/helicase